MSIHPTDLTARNRTAIRQATRATHETVAQIEQINVHAQRIATTEAATDWHRRHAQRLQVLADKAQHLADAAVEASINAQDLDGEHLIELAEAAELIRKDTYAIYLHIS